MNSKENTPKTDDKIILKKLEQQKLQAEIDELNKSIFQKPSFYAAMLPVLLGIFTLIFSTANGYFDVRIDEIEVRKKVLKYEEEKLQDSINFLSQKYEFKEAEYKQYLEELKTEYDSIQREQKNKIDFISIENTKVKNELNKNINDLRNSNIIEEDLKTKLEESFVVQGNQLFELNSLKSKISSNEIKIKNLEKVKDELLQTINQIKKTKSPWILITENIDTKPQPDVKVLLYSKNPVGWYNSVRVGYYSSKNNGFYVLNGKYANLTKLATHWKYIDSL